MDNEFALLNQFLEEMSGPQVLGHSSEPVTDKESDLIKKFAKGGLSNSQREQLVPTLVENEQAMHELVKMLKQSQR